MAAKLLGSSETEVHMTMEEVYASAIHPAMELLPSRMRSPEATVMLLAIGLQESRFEHRRQIGGPARGFWQFERGGGVKGVCEHPSSRFWMRGLCDDRRIPFTITSVYSSLEFDDVLAAGAARLLLFTDPNKLPDIGDADEAWDLYSRVWRPGRPHRHTWDAFHAQAVQFVKGYQ